MENKVAWSAKNIELLKSHFAFKYGLTSLALSRYSCEGIFGINTPTLYMYNADYRIYVLSDMGAVIDGSYTDTTFLFHTGDEESTKLVKVPYPYPYLKKPKLLVIDPFGEEDLI